MPVEAKKTTRQLTSFELKQSDKDILAVIGEQDGGAPMVVVVRKLIRQEAQRRGINLASIQTSDIHQPAYAD